MKSLSCVQLCGPIDCNLPDSSAHGIFQARVLEWVPISFSKDVLDPGIQVGSATLQEDALPSEPTGKPENPMNSMKKQKGMTLKDLLPRLAGAQHAKEKSGEIAPERRKGQSQSKNNTQLWGWWK